MENLHPSSSPTWLLRVTDLKQFAFCPRVVYYEYCTPGLRPVTYKMSAGIAEQERVAGLEERRSLRAYGFQSGQRHFNVTVTSPQLGYTGQADMVIETQVGGERRLFPVDFKLSRREPGQHFKLQLTAYALLLEEQFQAPVDEGALYLIPTKQVIKVKLTTRLRQETLRHLTAVRSLVAAERMPPPTSQRARCINCEFRRFCNDVL